ncbi:Crp/Fnr family transcriptional regulator [Flagellimonas pelagia]|uniref:Crp/Fnr family transcriptional regulator n=1 Tax=Flagellimonas pelagia TaxID=2306998 RepID=A0A3A1NM65_9FLAO|nr:Crp/Fnr family transcriptional regulator [Allomuricauda maritima]RIV47553.1 Crp/Fnr family transcriptional regulator [Allomuricauda maritima]TXK01643.1 Crp/Fnr family transcriptional regulator [Allomuricauda maritima]
MNKNGQLLRTALSSYSFLENEVWEEFEHFFIEKSIAKNEMIWENGEVCKHLVFIVKGAVRSFSMAHGNELTNNFYFDSDLFYDDYSFISQKPCFNNYQTLEDTDLLLIPRSALYLMFNKYKSFERLGRIVVECRYIELYESMTRKSNQSAGENYRYLMEHAKKVIQRVPLKMVASYLNITPEHLSRIRKSYASPRAKIA